MPEHPEGGDNSTSTIVGELTDQPTPRPDDQPTITELVNQEASGELEKQPEVVPTEPPVEAAQPEPVAAQEPATPELPDKFRGKTLDQVIEMYQNVERFAGELAEKKGQLEQIVRQIQSVPQPQPSPVQPTVAPVAQDTFQKAMDKYVEGDAKPLADLLEGQVNTKVQEELQRRIQAQTYQNEVAYRNALGVLESKADVELRKLAIERGVSYEEAEKRMAEEFNKDQALKTRAYSQPLTFTDQEVAKEIRRLYDQSVANEESKILNVLKRKGVNLDVAKQVAEAQKEIASTAVHTGSANKPVSETDGRPPEHEAELQRLGI